MNERLSLQIRDAELDDLAIIVEFNRLLALESESKTLDVAILTQGVRSLLADLSKGQYFLARHGDRIVGQLMLTYEWSDWRNGMIWWIQSVYVHPDFRRRGIYKALHEHVVRCAKDRGDVVGLRLYVEEQNHAGQATYLHVGMQPAGYRVLEQMF
jgi:GNAT superfamily N-acetyltransferase